MDQHGEQGIILRVYLLERPEPRIAWKFSSSALFDPVLIEQQVSHTDIVQIPRLVASCQQDTRDATGASSSPRPLSVSLFSVRLRWVEG
jgi:hypothetical protein